MSTCEQSGCTGHLGKFDSCRDEALYELALDGSEYTGDVDFNGTFHPIMLDEDTPVTIQDDTGRVVTVPAGRYIVHSLTSGAVNVYTYDSAELMAADYKVAEDEYAAWENDDED